MTRFPRGGFGVVVVVADVDDVVVVSSVLSGLDLEGLRALGLAMLYFVVMRVWFDAISWTCILY